MNNEELFYYNCHHCGNEGYSRQKQHYVCDFCLQIGHDDKVDCGICNKQFFQENER